MKMNTLKKDVLRLNDIKETYKSDLQEKKRTARSASRKTRRGGKVQTPSDLLTGKTLREYQGTSPVTVTSIHDHSIISFEDFKNLKTRREKTLTLYELRKRYSARQIADAWGTSLKLIYYYYNAYGVAGKNDVPEMVDAPAVEAKVQKKEPKVKAKLATSKTPPLQSECSFKAVGQYSAPSLARKLQGLAHTLHEGQLYKVEIHVTEVPHH